MDNENAPQLLPPMSAAEKYAANVAAIRILKALDTEKRGATAEERRALALYTGWGDTEVRRRAFQWHGGPASDEIASLGLSEEALDAMRRSALNAHYTELGVVRALWGVAMHLGFGELRGPRVLEPSCGVGHFLGLAPCGETDLAPERIVGVELDEVSAAITRALYPRCDVRRGGFEAQDLPASFDLAIGNVPFGDYRVSDERLPEGCRRQIHDYFVCRCVDLLRPGGVAVLITSKGTLDKESAFVRRWLAERAELLGAFRMPCDAFEENTGTQVTADVLVLQRLHRDQPGREPEWVGLEPVRFVGQYGQETEDRVNAYWLSHPDHVLGAWCQNKLVWRPDAGVRRREGDDRSVADMIRALIPRLPANVLAQGPAQRKATAPRPSDERGELVLRTPQELAVGRLLRAVRACVTADGPGPRRLLRAAYDGYVRQHGRLRDAEQRKHPLAHLARERWWPLVASCEDDHGREAGFLVGEAKGEAGRAKPETAADAMYQMLDERGSFDVGGVAERLGCDEAAAREGLRGLAYQLGPSGPWETAERYLSGDVVGKLDEARGWASLDGAFAENVEALQRSLPKPVPLAEVAVPLGAPWVPAKVYDDFLRHLFPAYWGHGVTLRYVAETGSWVFGVTDSRVLGSVENTRTYGTGRMTAVDLVECALKLQVPAVFDELPGDPPRRVRNEPESAAAQAKLAAIRDKWAAWLPRDEARTKLLEETYNHRFNRVRPRTYDGSRLSFPKLSGTYKGVSFSPYPHQLAGAQRILERGEKDDTALMTYMPGAGKTATAVLGLVKRLQLGLSDKVVVVVPKSVLGQWQMTFYELYPQLADWLLPGTDKAFDARNRRRFLLQAAGGGAKVVLLTYEQFRAVSLRPETFTAYLRREVSDLSQALTAVDEDDPAHRPLERAFKAREKALADFEAKYRDKWAKVEKAGESDLSWERWCEGRRVCLCIDECFRYETKVHTDRGHLPIGEIVEKRLSVNVWTKEGRWRPVTRWLKRSSVGKKWVKITHELGELVCTADHKIWTTSHGYVRASELTSCHTLMHGQKMQEMWCGDQRKKQDVLQLHLRSSWAGRSERASAFGGDDRTLLDLRRADRGPGARAKVLQPYVYGNIQNVAEDSQDVRMVCEELRSEERSCRESRAEVLRHLVFGEVAHEPTRVQGRGLCGEARQTRAYGGQEHACSFGEDAAGQPHVQGREPREGERGASRPEVPYGTRWERQDYGAATHVGGSAGMGDGGRDLHEGHSGGVREAAVGVQGGHRQSGSQSSDRGGWLLPQLSQSAGEGRQEGRRAGFSRVVGVEILESRDLEIGDDREGSGSCYDLEVEEDHNYFADGVLVSNCHLIKNDIVLTKMVGVSGLPRGESQRAFDMRVKLHYVTTPELFAGLSTREEGKAIGLTGTPVTNSLAETWVMLRHLQPRLLREIGCWHFDAWAATFTSQIACPEMDATGSWRVRTRLKFHNLPELQDLLGLCWDRVDPRKAGGKRPSIVGERMRVVETEGSEELRVYTRGLADRAELVKKRVVDPSEDNMLKITHDGRVASVFNGVPSETWPTDRVTKLDACAREVWDLYCHSDEASGVQLVFCDLFTPKAGSSEDAASLTPAEQFAQQGVYGVLRDKIVRAGVLPREVAYVHDAASDEERAELFRRANAGEVRVLIGSTARMGLGVNVQRRAYAVHHLTVPWRPDWLDQANKRVDRDGNTMEAVHIVCYPTTGSYDVVLWQMIETKANFVAAIGSGTYGGRTADDIGDLVIDATTAKAIALGDLRVVEKVKLELELAQLQRQHKAWKVENLRSRWELDSLPRQISEKDAQLADLEHLKSVRDANQLRGFSALLRPLMEAAPAASASSPVAASPPASWQPVTDRSRADAHVRELAQGLRHKLNEDGTLVGTYRGLELRLVRDPQGLHAVAGFPDRAEVRAQNVHMPGTLCFVALETALAGLETQIRRLSVQRSVLSSRFDSLRADAPSWPHSERAASLLSRYDDLCAAVATAGIVDRQHYKFDQ